MLKSMLITLLAFMGFACQQHPMPTIAYTLTPKDLIPEGITYSETTQSFYVGSLAKKKIVRIDAKTGTVKNFVSSEVLDLKVLGLLADDVRGHLWACANGTLNGQHRSVVACFDLKTGTLIRRYETVDTLRFTNNDLTLAPDGTVYYTDGDGDAVYRIPDGAKKAERFVHGDAIENPNGIALSPDGRYLYVASTTQGIRIIDTATRQVLPKAAPPIHSRGIDGLEFYQGNLIGMQNDVERIEDVRLCRFTLNAVGNQILREKTLDQANSLFNIPTTFAIVDDALYLLANSQMQHLRNGEIIYREHLAEPIVLKYNLK